MPEDKHEGREETGFTPASPVKRTLAWIGVVYALILLALTTYFYFTGTGLGNLGPLLTVPGLIGLGHCGAGVLADHRKAGENGRRSVWQFSAGCWPWPPCPSESPG